MKQRLLLLSSFAFCMAYLPVLGQINVVPIPAAQAVQDVLVGSGITTSNINAFTTNPNSIGVFNNGLQSNLGINRGIVLTSGLLANGNVQFSSPAGSFMGGVNNGGTDPNLNTIATGTQDRAVLQFDFVPAGDTLKFKYVFASEEYPEFAPPNSSTFNDVFAFFLTGPNPAGPAYNTSNVALLPGTATPVSINNVNAITNTAYYVANSSNNFVFDGYTVVLTAIAPVIPCSTYTIKLAIADVGDTAFDSAVFLEENSFGTGAVTISPSYNYNSAINDTLIYEGCSDVTITFFRDGVIGQADTVPVQISGSATNGVDYQYNGGPVPTQIIFAPGQASFDLTLTPIQDGINEPNENVTFTVTNINACGNVYTSTISLTITNVNPLDVNGGPDRQICPNVPQVFNGVITGGVPPYTSIWTQNGTPVGSNPLNITPGANATYIVTVTDGCTGSLAADTVNVTIGPPQFTVNEAIDSSACFGTDDGSIIIVVTGQTPPFSYLWTPGNLTTQNLSGLAPGTYTLQVTDTFGCQITETYQVYEPANIPLNFSDRFICSGDSINVNPNALPNTNYTWTPSQYFFGAQNTPTLSASTPGPQVDTLFINVVATTPGACGQDNFRIFVTPLPQVQLIDPEYDSTALCPGDTIPLSNALSNSGYPNVTGTLWSTGSSSSSIDATITGTYWLELTNNAGCKFRDSLEIYPVAPPNASIDTAFYICGSQPVTLFGTNYDPTTDDLLWSTGETTETISVNTDGIYYFYVSNYCATDTNMTKVIEIPTVELTDLPNIFTPNGDNINDTYSILDLFTYSIKFNVKIYNRWGAKVFETEDKEIDWSPKNISDGVYFMTILYLDCSNEEKKLAQTITVSSGK